MARSARTSVPYEDEELRKRGYYVGALLGEGSYAKVRYTFSATRGIFAAKQSLKGISDLAGELITLPSEVANVF